MKKSLLLALAAMVAVPGFAGVDPTNYATTEGLTCENVWLKDRNHFLDQFTAFEFGNNMKARTSVTVGTKAYIGYSRPMTINEENVEVAHIVIIDILSGELEKMVQVTVDGVPVTGLLCMNQIGVDDYGNFWFTGLVGTTTTEFKIYHVINPETGEAELAGVAELPESEMDAIGRHDYYDLVGDVTRREGRCVFMTPVASGTNTYVLGWACEQGSDVWGPHFEDYCSQSYLETYPADQTTWNGAPVIRIIRDEDNSGSLFYIDAFVTCPTLYSVDGAMIMSFADAPDLAPRADCNGVMEFKVGDHNLFAYVVGDYNVGCGSRINVCELGEGEAFEGMKYLWTLPETGLGTISDGGTRSFGINPTVFTDENGKQGAYLFLQKCYGGMGTWKIAEEGWIDPYASVADVHVDETDAPAEYFNLQGVRVNADNLANGIYLVRKGAKITKTIVK